MNLAKLRRGLACLPSIFCLNGFALPVVHPEVTDCRALIDRESTDVVQAYQNAQAAGVISPQHQCLLKTVDQVDDIGSLLEGISENTVVLIVHRKLADDSSSYTSFISFTYNPFSQEQGVELPSKLDPKAHLQSLKFKTRSEKQFFPRSADGSWEKLEFNIIEQGQANAEPMFSFNNAYLHFTKLPDSTQCVPSKTAAHMKKGTVLLGINENYDASSIPICEAEKPDHIWSMFEIGDNDRFEGVGKLYISGFSFYPRLDNNPNPVDSIWRVRCYTGSIYFENNYFRLDTRSSVYLQCAHNTKENVYFKFHGNAVVGMGSARSPEGLLVDFRHLEDGQNLTDIRDNWFSGNIKSAIEVRLDNTSRATIENNHVRPAIKELHDVQFGVELHGSFTCSHSRDKQPEITLRKNFLETENSSVQLFGELNLDIAGNMMKAGEPITAPEYTDEGHLANTLATLGSSEPNFWLSNEGECPDSPVQQAFTGNFDLVIQPGSKECNWAGMGQHKPVDL